MGRVDINHGVWVERGLAFASACFLVAASRVAFRGHYLREFATVLRAANISRASELASGWQKLKYVSVSETNLVKAVVGTVNWDKLRLEEREALALRHHLGEMLSYLVRPTLEDYYCLRTDQLNFKLVPTAVVPDAAPTTAHSTVEDRQAFDFVQQFWSARYETNRVPQIDAVCLQSVAVALSASSAFDMSVKGATGKLFTTLEIATNPGFRYGVDPDVSSLRPHIQRHGRFLNLSFYARVVPSGRCGPVFITLRWSPEAHKWVPHRLMADSTLAFRVLF